MKRSLACGAWFAFAALALAQAPAPGPALPCPNPEPLCPTPVESVAAKEPCLRADVGYLLWWVADGPLNFPLVTTGDPTQPAPGAIGTPGTRVLFGGNDLDFNTFAGLRGSFDVWLDGDRKVGLSLEGFGLFQRSNGFAAAGDANGNPPLYHPFYSALLNRPASFAIADPLGGGLGSLTGNVAIESTLEFWGAEANGLLNVYRDATWHLDALVGFRYLDLREDLRFQRSLRDFVFDIAQEQQESFRTSNQFYGAQLGGRLGLRAGALSLDVLGRVGLGSTHQVVTIQGQNFTTGTGAAVTGLTPGALYTAPSNIGRQERDRFGVVPQVQVKIGYALLEQVRVFVAYDYLYWNDVARPGRQMDGVLNVSQLGGGALVGPARPAPRFESSDFWAHGVTFGLELRF
jgi:hypothetical protein